MNDELFSYRLRKYREHHGITLDAMGAALGVTGRYVGMIERGDKDVEPSSSLYKLFVLMESNKVPAPGSHAARDHGEGSGLREETVTYKAGRPPGRLTKKDIVCQIIADMETITDGDPEEARRAFAFLKDVHVPLLGSLLNA